MIVVSMAIAGCTADGTSTEQPASRTPAATPPAGATDQVQTSGADASCPDVTGQLEAAAGPLKAGPFIESALHIPAAYHQAKIWISSSRPGTDNVLVTVTPPDGATTTSTRPGGEASADNAAQFWPGVIEIPESGNYRIDIDAGSDQMCVTAQFVRY